MLSVAECLERATECHRLAATLGRTAEYRGAMETMAAQWEEAARNRARMMGRQRQVEQLEVAMGGNG